MEQFHTVQDKKKYYFAVERDGEVMKVHSVVFGNKLHLFPLSVGDAETKTPFEAKSYRDAVKKAKAKHGVASVVEHPDLVAHIKKSGQNIEVTAVRVTAGTYVDASTTLMDILT